MSLARKFAIGLLLLVLICVPFLPFSKYQLHVINLIAVSAILAMSLDRAKTNSPLSVAKEHIHG